MKIAAPKTEEETAHTPGPLTTIKFTTTVEFTPEQWTEYREAMNLNYGETTTKKSAQVWMKGEARHGLEHHLEVQGMNNWEVTIK